MKAGKLISKTLAGFLKFRVGRGRPLFATYDVTSRCNMKCAYCDWWKMSTPELPTREAFRVIDRICQLGVSFFNFCGGEPMMRKDLMALAERASTYGCVVGMNTNGTLLKAGEVSEIADAFDVVTVSLDGPREVHDAGRGVKGSFDRAVEGIRLLKADGARVGVSVVLSPWNVRTIPQFVEWLRNSVDFVTIQPIHPYPPPLQNKPSPKAVLRAMDFLLKLKREDSKLISVPTDFVQGFKPFFDGKAPKICHAGELYMAIDPMGRLKPCAARSDVVLGNILNRTAGEMLRNRTKNPAWSKVSCCEGCWLDCTVGISMWMRKPLREAVHLFGL
ncbi:MAG: radical SAM protein [Candidatus Bathyarchaeota archaeon]|nr:MAG: radical SAM protein [Candidatus Bathyarchaeota archaeon]